MENSTVFFSVSHLKIMTAKHLLEEAGIVSHSINKLDSAHAGVFGDIELYVDKKDEEAARKILKEAEIL
ncbi:MAG: DUF2007 domain-containing protein [Saprospiraceae bacterium]|nr:DUF2007 domain-containing protein [Bacteroidia bacterium]NNE16230.1 DUF2007 domain-containing protein [Saprospiraceae bacterium]NNL91208.1 DUF2007 domain-containing protein [Saprospiraceae bacterium]